jgi:hypothetical protein
MTWTPPHHPKYVYCPDPDICCEHPWPVAITCAVDHQRWPCETKRSHHTETHAERVKRWADGRRGRAPRLVNAA